MAGPSRLEEILAKLESLTQEQRDAVAALVNTSAPEPPKGKGEGKGKDKGKGKGKGKTPTVEPAAEPEAPKVASVGTAPEGSKLPEYGDLNLPDPEDTDDLEDFPDQEFTESRTLTGQKRTAALQESGVLDEITDKVNSYIYNNDGLKARRIYFHTAIDGIGELQSEGGVPIRDADGYGMFDDIGTVNEIVRDGKTGTKEVIETYANPYRVYIMEAPWVKLAKSNVNDVDRKLYYLIVTPSLTQFTHTHAPILSGVVEDNRADALKWRGTGFRLDDEGNPIASPAEGLIKVQRAERANRVNLQRVLAPYIDKALTADDVNRIHHALKSLVFEDGEFMYVDRVLVDSLPVTRLLQDEDGAVRSYHIPSPDFVTAISETRGGNLEETLRKLQGMTGLSPEIVDTAIHRERVLMNARGNPILDDRGNVLKSLYSDMDRTDTRIPDPETDRKVSLREQIPVDERVAEDSFKRLSTKVKGAELTPGGEVPILRENRNRKDDPIVAHRQPGYLPDNAKTSSVTMGRNGEKVTILSGLKEPWETLTTPRGKIFPMGDENFNKFLVANKIVTEHPEGEAAETEFLGRNPDVDSDNLYYQFSKSKETRVPGSPIHIGDIVSKPGNPRLLGRVVKVDDVYDEGTVQSGGPKVDDKTKLKAKKELEARIAELRKEGNLDEARRLQDTLKKGRKVNSFVTVEWDATALDNERQKLQDRIDKFMERGMEAEASDLQKKLDSLPVRHVDEELAVGELDFWKYKALPTEGVYSTVTGPKAIVQSTNALVFNRGGAAATGLDTMAYERKALGGSVGLVKVEGEKDLYRLVTPLGKGNLGLKDETNTLVKWKQILNDRGYFSSTDKDVIKNMSKEEKQKMGMATMKAKANGKFPEKAKMFHLRTDLSDKRLQESKARRLNIALADEAVLQKVLDGPNAGKYVMARPVIHEFGDAPRPLSEWKDLLDEYGYRYAGGPVTGAGQLKETKNTVNDMESNIAALKKAGYQEMTEEDLATKGTPVYEGKAKRPSWIKQQSAGRYEGYARGVNDVETFVGDGRTRYPQRDALESERPIRYGQNLSFEAQNAAEDRFLPNESRYRGRAATPEEIERGPFVGPMPNPKRGQEIPGKHRISTDSVTVQPPEWRLKPIGKPAPTNEGSGLAPIRRYRPISRTLEDILEPGDTPYTYMVPDIKKLQASEVADPTSWYVPIRVPANTINFPVFEVDSKTGSKGSTSAKSQVTYQYVPEGEYVARIIEPMPGGTVRYQIIRPLLGGIDPNSLVDAEEEAAMIKEGQKISKIKAAQWEQRGIKDDSVKFPAGYIDGMTPTSDRVKLLPTMQLMGPADRLREMMIPAIEDLKKRGQLEDWEEYILRTEIPEYDPDKKINFDDMGNFGKQTKFPQGDDLVVVYKGTPIKRPTKLVATRSLYRELPPAPSRNTPAEPGVYAPTRAAYPPQAGKYTTVEYDPEVHDKFVGTPAQQQRAAEKRAAERAAQLEQSARRAGPQFDSYSGGNRANYLNMGPRRSARVLERLDERGALDGALKGNLISVTTDGKLVPRVSMKYAGPGTKILSDWPASEGGIRRLASKFNDNSAKYVTKQELDWSRYEGAPRHSFEGFEEGFLPVDPDDPSTYEEIPQYKWARLKRAYTHFDSEGKPTSPRRLEVVDDGIVDSLDNLPWDIRSRMVTPEESILQPEQSVQQMTMFDDLVPKTLKPRVDPFTGEKIPVLEAEIQEAKQFGKYASDEFAEMMNAAKRPGSFQKFLGPMGSLASLLTLLGHQMHNNRQTY